MCGIAGLLGVRPDLANPAAKCMLEAMRHRGPDDWGIETIPDPLGQGQPIVLVHTRLAIRDLSSAGRQPMSDAPRRDTVPGNWVVFNGEIYNFLELTAKLSHAGWPSRTRCDTETILHGYRAWGEKCVTRFRGMFAWALVDTHARHVWFCRDRLGIKPIYLMHPPGGGLVFASEVRTLLAAGSALVRPCIDHAALESYLAQGAVFGHQSLIQNVELLPPGVSLRTDWSGHELIRTKYWQLGFRPDSKGPTNRVDSVEQLAEKLRVSVKSHLTADVPVGLFLSSGVDSAAIATIATEVAGTDIQTISIGFDEPKFDETGGAEETARRLGTQHRSLRLTGGDILEGFSSVLAAVDQPTVDGFNTFFVARTARRAGLTVALSGLGADELFGGYASFRDVPRALRLRRLPLSSRLPSGIMRLMAVFGSRGIAKTAALFDRPATPIHIYLLRRELFLSEDRRSLHRLPLASDPYSGVPNATIDEFVTGADGSDLVNQISQFELSGYLRHMLLRDADVFSMTHNMELRVPLIDHELVEAATAITGRFKMPDPRPKPLLLDAVGARLPTLTYTQPKRGFTFPWDAWLRGPLNRLACCCVRKGDVWQSLGINPDGPPRLLERFTCGDRRVPGLQVLALLVLVEFAERHQLKAAA